jgi:hypothetical protein
MFLRTYPEVKRTELVRKLSTTCTARELAITASSLKKSLGYHTPELVARVILSTYNKGRRSGEMPNRFNV